MQNEIISHSRTAFKNGYLLSSVGLSSMSSILSVDVVYIVLTETESMGKENWCKYSSQSCNFLFAKRNHGAAQLQIVYYIVANGKRRRKATGCVKNWIVTSFA